MISNTLALVNLDGITGWLEWVWGLWEGLEEFAVVLVCLKMLASRAPSRAAALSDRPTNGSPQYPQAQICGLSVLM